MGEKNMQLDELEEKVQSYIADFNATHNRMISTRELCEAFQDYDYKIIKKIVNSLIIKRYVTVKRRSDFQQSEEIREDACMDQVVPVPVYNQDNWCIEEDGYLPAFFDGMMRPENLFYFRVPQSLSDSYQGDPNFEQYLESGTLILCEKVDHVNSVERTYLCLLNREVTIKTLFRKNNRYYDYFGENYENDEIIILGKILSTIKLFY